MKGCKGFTLIELMSTLGIAGILLTVGLPSMNEMIIRQRVNSYQQTLADTLHTARQAAILNSAYVTVCASHSGEQCENDWSQGHLIFLDHNGNRMFDLEDKPLNFIEGINKSDSVKWASFAPKPTLQYLPTGITNHQNGTFTVCGLSQQKYARAIIITKMGRPRLSKDSNGDGIHEGANGAALSC